MGNHRELFGQIAVAEDTNTVNGAFDESGSSQSGFVHARALLETFFQVAHIDDGPHFAPRVMAEAPFRQTAYQRHLSAFFERRRQFGPCSAQLAFVPPGCGFAVATADSPADTLFALELMYALVNGR